MYVFTEDEILSTRGQDSIGSPLVHLKITKLFFYNQSDYQPLNRRNS